MKKITIKNITGRNITLKDFEKAEELLGYRIPDDYKDFLIQNNGGYLKGYEFITKDKKVEGFISEILPFDNNSEDSVIEEISSITLSGWVLPYILCIAKTPDQNRIVISCDKRDFGSIYFWAWDEQMEDDKPGYKYMRLISTSFQEFLNSLLYQQK